MEKEILYMLGVVAVGFAVNYSLRALPFMLFAGRDRALPPWVAKFGNFISPVIIGALIIYSYSGLEWKTAWPYLAGVLTVLLQLWRKNALLSIVLGTALYMFLVAGCTTTRQVQYGVDKPLLELSHLGLKFDGRFVDSAEVPDLLEEYRIPHDAVIHIKISPEMQHELRSVRTFLAYLASKGYKRPVLVTGMHGDSEVKQQSYGGYRGKSAAGQNQQVVRPKVRYKGANE